MAHQCQMFIFLLEPLHLFSLLLLPNCEDILADLSLTSHFLSPLHPIPHNLVLSAELTKREIEREKWLTLTLKNFPYLMQWVVGWQMLTSELSFSDDNSWLLAVGRPRCWAVSGLGVRIMGFTPSYPLPPGTLFTCLVEEAKNGGGGRNGNWLNKGKVQSWNFTYLTPGNHGLTYLLFWEVEK